MYLDPIADLLVRIKTGTKAKKDVIEVRTSKIVTSILKLLKDEGYIVSYENKDIGNNKKITEITLKYKDNISSIMGVRQISKPGLRIYSESEKLPKVLNGLGVAIISTSKGLMTDRDARKNHIGGEVIAYVW